MYLAQKVRLISSNGPQIAISALGRRDAPIDLSALRSHAAWILLADPGAGKTTAFKHEAKQTGGKYLTVTEFLSQEIAQLDPAASLFIDALDQHRELGSRHALLAQIATRLREIGKPKFRIACRAADWWQSSATESVTGSLARTLLVSSADGSLSLFGLSPLSAAEINQLPQAQRPRITKPTCSAEVYEVACSQLVNEMNPGPNDCQTQIAQPYTRDELINMAGYLCTALLLSGYAGISLNPANNNVAFAHIDDLQPEDVKLALQVVHSKLFASSHAACDSIDESGSGKACAQFLPADQRTAQYLAARWLSNQVDRNNMTKEQLLRLLTRIDGQAIGNLRGVYGWLAQINRAAQSLLIESDPICVLLSTNIANITNTVGTTQGACPEQTTDSPSTSGQLQALFSALKQQALKDPAPLMHLQQLAASMPSGYTLGFGGFASFGQAMVLHSGIYQQLLDDLTSPSRNDNHQVWIMFLMTLLMAALRDDARATALASVATDPSWAAALGPVLQNMVLDASRSEHTRKLALRLWLRANNQPQSGKQALELLQLIHGQALLAPALDSKLELTGILLAALYPATIPSEQILGFCHVPVSKHLGSYQAFWVHQFAGLIPKSDLPLIMNELARRQDLRPTQWDTLGLDQMLAAVMRRALDAFGNQTDAQQLYDWLHLGCDTHGQRWNRPHCHDVVHGWLTQQQQQRHQPQDRYTDLLRVAYDRSVLKANTGQDSENDTENVSHAEFAQALLYNTRFLQTVTPPHGIGAWHLEQAEGLAKKPGVSNNALIRAHLHEAIKSLWADLGDPITDGNIAGHTPLGSLEHLVDLARRYPVVDALMQGSLRPMMVCAWTPQSPGLTSTPSHALHDAGLSTQTNQPNRISIERAARTRELDKRLIQIPPAQVHPALLNQLARLWANELPEFADQDLRTRFAQYCDNPDEVMRATKRALIACIDRPDLPSAPQIIEAASNNQHYPIGKACLVGMSLIDSGVDAVTDLVTDLRDDTLGALVCWQLHDASHGADVPTAACWLDTVLAKKTGLVAQVMIQSICAELKGFADNVAGVDQLVSDWRYSAVAPAVIPAALKAFPVRHKANQLRVLRQLIHGAMRHCPDALMAIVHKKLQQKSPLPSQRVYWLLAGTLLQPDTHEAKLWAFVGSNWEREAEIGLFFEGGITWCPTQTVRTTQTASKGETTLAKAIELLMPKAVVEAALEFMPLTPAMQVGQTVRHLIGLLGQCGTEASVAELDRLLEVPELASVREVLLSAKQDAAQALLIAQAGGAQAYRRTNLLNGLVKELRP